MQNAGIVSISFLFDFYCYSFQVLNEMEDEAED